MTITTEVRIAAAAFDHQRLLEAEGRLAAAKLNDGETHDLDANFFANAICVSPGENLIEKVRSERTTG